MVIMTRRQMITCTTMMMMGRRMKKMTMMIILGRAAAVACTRSTSIHSTKKMPRRKLRLTGNQSMLMMTTEMISMLWSCYLLHRWKRLQPFCILSEVPSLDRHPGSGIVHCWRALCKIPIVLLWSRPFPLLYGKIHFNM